MLAGLTILLIVLVVIGIVIMSDSTERLRAEIAENTSAIDAAVVLINGLENRLREALMSEDVEGEVETLADELSANTDKLATALAENTASAEDSDSVYDPAPIGEEHVDESEAEGQPDLGEVPSSDESASSSEADAPSDATSESTTSTSSGDSDTAYAGEGAISSDTAVDTSATTDSPQYGVGDGSVESASEEGNSSSSSDTSIDSTDSEDSSPSSGSSEDESDSSDENGQSVA